MSLMAFMETMGTSNINMLAAFFIGLMMSISPCPLATNITAIAYISKKIKDKKHTLLVSFAYTLGRMFTYITLATLIVWFGVNIQNVALFLQKYGHKILGPLLIIIGIVMLDVIKINLQKFKQKNKSEKNKISEKIKNLKEKLSKKGILGSFLLGIIFALAFCPFSAVLFFGMLIPIAIKANDGIIIPAIFSLATGLPVIILSLILVHSVSKLSKIMNKIQIVEKYTRKTVAIIFILVGIYYVWINIF